VMLIDERTQSQAEHTGLFLRAANGTAFIGSPTAGADGDVTTLVVPGGIELSFSGQGVEAVDGTRLQRVGLKPDVLVRPTLAGIRAGRDEVLERALTWVRGRLAKTHQAAARRSGRPTSRAETRHTWRHDPPTSPAAPPSRGPGGPPGSSPSSRAR
jgi:C-terminal processing protease CtpA/Prc